MTRITRIFLGSSAELDNDKVLVENFFARKNRDWRADRIFLELTTWRDFLSSVTMERTQEQYNRYIRSSDICIFLFHTKVGRFTREEFDQAYAAFLESHGHVKRPRIYTFFKSNSDEHPDITQFRDYLGTLGNIRNRVDDPTLDTGHFYDTYVSMDELFLKLGRQLDLLRNEHEILRPERIDVPLIAKYGLFGFLLPLLVIAGAWGTLEYRQPGQLSVRVLESRPIPNMRFERGMITLAYEGRTESKEIRDEVLFAEIASSSKRKQGRVRFESEGYLPIDTSVKLDGKLILSIQRDSTYARVFGVVKDHVTGKSVAGATISVQGHRVASDSSGRFRIPIPLEEQAHRQRVEVRANGYKQINRDEEIVGVEISFHLHREGE